MDAINNDGPLTVKYEIQISVLEIWSHVYVSVLCSIWSRIAVFLLSRPYTCQ